MKVKIIAFVCAFLLSACTVHIMDAELVSMHTKEMPNKALTKGERIEKKWCINEDPIIPSPDDQYGLIDQVVAKAEKETNSKYFLETSFYRNNKCVTMTGYTTTGAGEQTPTGKPDAKGKGSPAPKAKKSKAGKKA